MHVPGAPLHYKLYMQHIVADFSFLSKGSFVVLLSESLAELEIGAGCCIYLKRCTWFGKYCFLFFWNKLHVHNCLQGNWDIRNMNVLKCFKRWVCKCASKFVCVCVCA